MEKPTMSTHATILIPNAAPSGTLIQRTKYSTPKHVAPYTLGKIARKKLGRRIYAGVGPRPPKNSTDISDPAEVAEKIFNPSNQTLFKSGAAAPSTPPHPPKGANDSARTSKSPKTIFLLWTTGVSPLEIWAYITRTAQTRNPGEGLPRGVITLSRQKNGRGGCQSWWLDPCQVKYYSSSNWFQPQKYDGLAPNYDTTDTTVLVIGWIYNWGLQPIPHACHWRQGCLQCGWEKINIINLSIGFHKKYFYSWDFGNNNILLLCTKSGGLRSIPGRGSRSRGN